MIEIKEATPLLEDKQEFLNRICSALQLSRQFAPGLGGNGLVEIRYVQRNGEEYASPRFEDDPERDDGYYDVNITCDSLTAIFMDLDRWFVKKMG